MKKREELAEEDTKEIDKLEKKRNEELARLLVKSKLEEERLAKEQEEK